MPFVKTHNYASRFSDDLKNEIFMIWYQAGKPSPSILYNLLPEDLYPKPAVTTLHGWIYTSPDNFKDAGELLDEEVREEISEKLIQSKVEMFERHALVGQKLQNLALEFLETEGIEWTTASAVRALVEGVRIEMQSMGIPDMLKKISDMTDDDLEEEIKKLATSSPVTIEPLDDYE